MNKSNKNKDFDCLEFKDNVQKEIYEIIKDMSPEEEKNYFNKKAMQGTFKNLVKSSKLSLQLT